jgi:nucleoside phosphorylase
MDISELNMGGIGASLETLQNSISVLHPSAVIMVGEAFGINAQKQAIGDILVSQQLRLYDIGRIDEAGIIPRGDRPSTSSWLLNRFRAATSSWEGAKVNFGVILTGDKLIDKADYRDQLMLLEPEAIGGEMEGAGLWLVKRVSCSRHALRAVGAQLSGACQTRIH